LEEAGDAYREIMGVSEPEAEQFIRVDIYAVLGFVLRSAMYVDGPVRRVM
jgi:hypothetical protein